MTKESRRLGERGEDAAAAYLERAGMTVVERNWTCSAGEVDVIALDGDELVFCEVKTRKTASKGTPDEAVTPVKQRRYGRIAAAYLQANRLDHGMVRFDVVSILVIAQDRALLRHHRAAFTIDAASS